MRLQDLFESNANLNTAKAIANELHAEVMDLLQVRMAGTSNPHHEQSLRDSIQELLAQLEQLGFEYDTKTPDHLRPLTLDMKEGLRNPSDNPCWKGYHPVGTKKKNGRTVPNCVPNANKGMAESAPTGTVRFVLDTERAYRAVLDRLGDFIDWDENEYMIVPERLWPKVQQIAYDADGIGAESVDDMQDIEEFVDVSAQTQDPGVEKERNVDVIIYGRMPQDFTAQQAWEALEEVLPQEYPQGSSLKPGPAQYKINELSKSGGVIVTSKPQAVANKLVKTFQTYGIKSRIA